MYKLLLILRYLRRKLAPLFAVLAVTLCTAMVIIVISVMGGFLELMRNAAQTLTGDITIRSGMAGLPHFEKLIGELNALPEVESATPVIRAFGLVKILGLTRPVEVLGIRPGPFHQVMLHPDPTTGEAVGYRDTLYWGPEHLSEAYKDMNLRELGMTMKAPPQWSSRPDEQGFVPGIEVSPFNTRNDEGDYGIANSSIGSRATITLLPLTEQGAVLEPAVRELMVVNEFKSGLYEVDANRAYAPFQLVQSMLKMDAYEIFDPDSGEATGETRPARASEIMIRGARNVPLSVIQQTVEQSMTRFARENPGMPPVEVVTWRQLHATLLGAVEKEKLMVTFLFAFISIVAVVMIAVIFYMIVLEKTRDIGTLRAVGASRSGVATIFLGYGLAIGVLGAFLGLALAATIVWNINEIQEFLAWSIGFQMWNPQIYYFDRIPHSLDGREVFTIVIVAIISSVAGSVVPAFLAARLNPVEALCYE